MIITRDTILEKLEFNLDLWKEWSLRLETKEEIFNRVKYCLHMQHIKNIYIQINALPTNEIVIWVLVSLSDRKIKFNTNMDELFLLLTKL